MALKTKPEIRRSYSSIFDIAVKQHLSDIYKYYSLGWDYHDTIEDEDLLNANKKHFGKLKWKLKRETDIEKRKILAKEKNGFPFLAKAAFHVYSRDEDHLIPQSKWSSFQYLMPLQVLEFVIHEFDTGNRYLLDIVSLLFVLFLEKNRTNEDYELNSKIDTWSNTRDKIKANIRKRNTEFTQQKGNLFSKEAKQLRKKIRKLEAQNQKVVNYSSRSIHPIIFEKPSELYNLAQLTQERFTSYAEILGLDFVYDQWHENQWGTRLWVFKLNELEAKFKRFVEKDKKKWKLKGAEVTAEVLLSGIQLNKFKKMNNLGEKYERTSLQNKYSYLSWRELEGNKLIRIEKGKDGFNIAIQNHFYNYRFLLVSLYLRGTGKQKRVKSHIQLIASEDAIRSFKNAKRTFKLLELRSIFTKLGLESRKSSTFYDGFNVDPSKHFDQIKKVLPIVQSISQNGIYINKKAAFIIYKEALAEWKIEYSKSDKFIERDDIEESEKYDSKRVALEKKLTSIKKIVGATSSLNNFEDKEPRIHGMFSAHGAKTHRLSCRWINLQGISSRISEKIFSAPPGRVLVSADVSGQDIVVAAHMAQKLYNCPEVFNGGDALQTRFQELNNQLNESIKKLKNPSEEAKPKVIIRNSIINSDNSHLIIGMTEKELTDFIKKSIFTKLFGGGKRTITKAILEPSERDEIISELREQLIIFEKSIRLDLKTDVNNSMFSKKFLNEGNKLKVEELEVAIATITGFIKKLFAYGKEKEYDNRFGLESAWYEDIRSITKTFDGLNKDAEEIEKVKLLFDIVEDTIKKEYPGIMEAFEYYKLYYEDNHATYPTFLSWSTIIDFPETIKKIASISKSYPIQASGAEYMRQWLLELSEAKGYCKKFWIANTVHDQVLLEVDEKFEVEAHDILYTTSKEAARTIGIHPDTLHIEFE